MIRSSHRNPKVQAMAEMLALMAASDLALASSPRRTSAAEEGSWESASDFCAALEKFVAHVAKAKRQICSPN